MEHKFELSYVASKYETPIKVVGLTIAGNDTIKIVAGHNLDVPNVWELLSARISVVASADVGNRYISMLNYDQSGVAYGDTVSSGAIAASQSKAMTISRLAYWDVTKATGGPTDTFFISVGTMAFLIQDKDYCKIYLSAGFAGDAVTVRTRWRSINDNLNMMQPQHYGVPYNRWPQN